MDNGTPPRRPRSVYVVSDAALLSALAHARLPRESEEILEPLHKRWREARVEMDAFCADLVATLGLTPPAPDPRALVMPVVTDALAHLRRPKREGNRAERRAKGRR